MATLVRILLKPLALLLALAQNATAAPSVGPVPPTPVPLEGSGMSAFLKRLKQDPDLRTRFGRDPRAAFRELGIDPAPFQLPETLDAARIDDFLRAWTGPTGPTQGLSASADGSRSSTEGSPLQVAQTSAALVYGPPPTPAPRRSDVPPPPTRPTQPDESPPTPAPPAPVYGPPPGLPRP